MSSEIRRYKGPIAGKAPNFDTFGQRRPRKENIRFGSNRGRSYKGNLVIDENIQEATPEHLRIEIDKIIKDFLADHEQTVYIFPPDLNNLQRKYIHYKAQTMNIVSKSHGKPPNRQLHLRKKPKEVSTQSFRINICYEIREELEKFDQKYGEEHSQPQTYKAVKRYEKIYGRLQDTEPVVPKATQISEDIQLARNCLPIFDKKELVMDAIYKNQVIIICSETGSGKTTQIPQFIMEDACQKSIPCKIMCTQPRRISTVAAAERVAYERGENVGGCVGYQIRLESKCGYNTNLMYCTVGVFLRNLMCGNKCLKNISHVIVDEIHERDKLSDFMLICLKQNLPLFPHLKVILMSATVDTTKFQEYFKSSAVLSIPGRLYPIQSYFLEDVLSMTQFFTPQMRAAMNKLQKQQTVPSEVPSKVELSPEDQENLNDALEAYMNFSEDYDYKIHYEEATVDLLQLFLSEEVPVDQQHSERGWTALMIACHLGDVEFISKLCTMGASLDIADAMGKTAYDYAKTVNKNNTLELLDFIRQQKSSDKTTPNTNDSQYLRQLYDMTTPDDFIDYDLIVALIKFIHAKSDSGSMLVFLPGYDEIMQCSDYIAASELDSSSYRIFFLHSSMNMRDQCDVFKPLPNKRKIILSTNIAETSITVEDVVFVIDVGKVKEKVYDSYNKLSALQTQWISRACAKQREGRAGRVKPGFCFRLYSSQRFSHMAEERVPEILRVSLEELCLNAKIIAPKSMNIYNFLSLAPDPPTANSVNVAIENLQSLGALDKEEDLTRLGEYLAQLTLEPRLGKMLIYGCIFKCLEPLLTLSAAMAHKDPFQLPPQATLRTAAAAKRRELIANVPSDHVIYLKVFQRWQEEASRGRSKQFCHEYFISEPTMNSVLETRRQLLGQLRAVGFVNNTHNIDEFNVNSNSWGLVKAIMSAAFFPNVAYPVQAGTLLATRNEKKVSIHNTSVCSSKIYQHWCFFDEMVKNRISFMMRGVTLLTPLMVAVMCGIDAVYPTPHSIDIDDWLQFNFEDALLIKLRSAVQTLVDKSMINPWHSFDKSNQIVSDTLRTVMDLEESRSLLRQPENVGVRPKFLYKIIHDNKMSKPDVPITRAGMRQKPTSNTNDFIEMHKKGRTPKRFIPPHKQPPQVPHTSGAARTLRFDAAGHNVSQRFQGMNLDSDTHNYNVRSLGTNYDSRYVPDHYGRYNNQSYGVNFMQRNSGFSRPSDHHDEFNSYAAYDSGFSNTHGQSNQGLVMGCNTNTNTTLAARRIVKQLDLTDYKYNDAYSLPQITQIQTQNTSYIETIDFPDFIRTAQPYPVPPPQYQNVLPCQWSYDFKVPHVQQCSSPSFSEKFYDYVDNPIFLIIRASEKRNIDIAQSCNKWVFSPQTEKRVLSLGSKEKTIYLVFYVKDLQMFMGVAEYKCLNIGKTFSKPTATISWIFTSPLHKNKTKHLLNPYNFDKPIFDAQDGVVIPQNIGEELMRIYLETENVKNE